MLGDWNAVWAACEAWSENGRARTMNRRFDVTQHPHVVGVSGATSVRGLTSSSWARGDPFFALVRTIVTFYCVFLSRVFWNVQCGRICDQEAQKHTHWMEGRKGPVRLLVVFGATATETHAGTDATRDTEYLEWTEGDSQSVWCSSPTTLKATSFGASSHSPTDIMPSSQPDVHSAASMLEHQAAAGGQLKYHLNWVGASWANTEKLRLQRRGRP